MRLNGTEPIHYVCYSIAAAHYAAAQIHLYLRTYTLEKQILLISYSALWVSLGLAYKVHVYKDG